MKHHRSRSVVSPLLAAVIAIGATLGFLALTSLAGGAATKNQTSAGTSKGSDPAVEICNVSGDTGQQGATYPLEYGAWNGSWGAATSLTAEPSPGTCTSPKTTDAGTLVGVEQGTLGAGLGSSVNVAFTVANGSFAAQVPSIDLVVAHVASSGTTIVTITDHTPPPPGVGTLELCKVAGDSFVDGQTFNFTITATGFSSTQNVLAGECNDVPGVPAGQVTVVETYKFPYEQTSVSTIPSTAYVSSSNETQTSVVDVYPTQTTTVFVTNATVTAYAKVCKTLRSAADDGLAGQTFTFNVSATFNGAPVPGVPSTVSVVAQDYPNVPCTFLTESNGNLFPLPLGSIVTATEQVPSDAAVTSTVTSPSNLDDGSTPGTAVFFVGNTGSSGTGNLGGGTVTQTTFTNEGLGRVKVCKTSNTIATGTVFNFTVGDGVGTVQAGVNTFCSLAYTLPVGTVSVTENPGPEGADISTTWSDTLGEFGSGTSATVTVPFNTENDVTFDNEIKTGDLQVCKQQTSSDAGLQNTYFNLTYSWTGSSSTMVSLEPGQCTNQITVPTLTPTLTPVTISIYEGTVDVSYVNLENVTVQGPDTVVSAAAPPDHLVGTGGSNSPDEVLNSVVGVTDVNFINGIVIPPAS
jgi:hypothetical protein